MKIAPLGVLIAISVGVMLLRFSFVHAGMENWVPVNLPFPGAGLAVSDRFHLESGGRFRVQIVTPMREGSRGSEGSAVSSLSGTLLVEMLAPNGIRSNRVITKFRTSGTAGDAATYAAGDLIELPAGGDYEISLKTEAGIDLFRERGALIQLVRVSPVGPDMMYPIARWAAYGLFAVAVLAAFVGRNDRE